MAAPAKRTRGAIDRVEDEEVLRDLNARMLEECWAKCIAKPPREPTLSAGEEAAVERCMWKFFQAYDMIVTSIRDSQAAAEAVATATPRP